MSRTQYLLFILAYIFCVLQGHSINISGRVTDSGHEPVYGASCMVFTLPDSVFYVLSLTDRAGVFNTEIPDSASWYVSISSVGYNTVNVDSGFFTECCDTDSLPTVVLTEHSTDLREIVVRSRRPQLTQKDGVLHYNINEILSTQVVSSVHDVLRHLPLLTSDDGSRLSLSGAPQGSVVYVNGDRTQMDQQQLMEYLKSIPASQLKDVEIIYNPEPRWQTRSAVINVVLRKTEAYSVNGMAGAYGILRHNASGGGRLSLFSGLPRLSVNAMYSFDAAESTGKKTSYGRHEVGSEIYEVNDTTLTRDSSPSHNVYTSLDYEFNSRNSAELSYYGSFAPHSDSHVRTSNSLYGPYLSSTVSDWRLNSVSMIYKNSAGIRGGVDYRDYRRHNSQQIFSDSAEEESGVLSSTAHQKVVTVRAYVDFTTPCPRKWTLMYGGNFDFSLNTNTLHSVSETESMEGISTSSHLNEKTGRLYFGAYRYFFSNRLFIRASLAGELYRIGDYRNNQLLPALTLMYIPDPGHIFQGAYSSYRTYPPYWQRQVYAIYSSPYDLSLGNPLLKPVHYHTLRMLYVFNSRYTLSATYYRVNNFYLNQTYQSPDALLRISQPYNIDFTSTWTLLLSVPIQAGNFLTTNLTVDGSWERFRSDDWHSLSFDRRRFALRVTAYTSLVLCQQPRISVNLTGFYKTPSQAGLWRNGHAWLLNAGMAASLLKGKLTVDFQANDILQSLYSVQRMRLGTQYLDYDYNYYRRAFSLNVSYKFRGYREKETRTPDSSRLGID